MELKRGRGGAECNMSEVGGLNLENGDEDMKNWMSSVQLWNYHDNDSHDLKSVIWRKKSCLTVSNFIRNGSLIVLK